MAPVTATNCCRAVDEAFGALWWELWCRDIVMS